MNGKTKEYGGGCVYCGLVGDHQQKNHIGYHCPPCTVFSRHTGETYRDLINSMRHAFKAIGVRVTGEPYFHYETHYESDAFDDVIHRHNIRDASHKHTVLDHWFLQNPNNKDDWYWYDTKRNYWVPTSSRTDNRLIYKIEGEK